MNTRFAHLSDLHFGALAHGVEKALHHSLSNLDLDAIFISGDLTQRALKREFQTAASFIQALPCPVLVVPGNHDMSSHNLLERFIYPWRPWRRHISGELEPTLAQPGLHVAGVNTARRAGMYWDWSRGRINQQQLTRLNRFFATAPNQALRIVIAHHPFWLPAADHKRHLIGRHDTALAEFSHNKVDLVLGGHVHRRFAAIQSGIIIAHSGTTTSRRLLEGERNGFNLFESDSPNQLRLTHMEGHRDGFTADGVLHYRKDPHGHAWRHHPPGYKA